MSEEKRIDPTDELSRDQILEFLLRICYTNMKLAQNIKDKTKTINDDSFKDYFCWLDDSLHLSLEDYLIEMQPRMEAYNLNCPVKDLPLNFKQMIGYYRNKITRIKKSRSKSKAEGIDG